MEEHHQSQGPPKKILEDGWFDGKWNPAMRGKKPAKRDERVTDWIDESQEGHKIPPMGRGYGSIPPKEETGIKIKSKPQKYASSSDERPCKNLSLSHYTRLFSTQWRLDDP
jgi:hypothetical protein